MSSIENKIFRSVSLQDRYEQEHPRINASKLSSDLDIVAWVCEEVFMNHRSKKYLMESDPEILDVVNWCIKRIPDIPDSNDLDEDVLCDYGSLDTLLRLAAVYDVE